MNIIPRKPKLGGKAMQFLRVPVCGSTFLKA